MIGLIIWSIVAIIFVEIGISAYKSEKAVGFFTFAEPHIVNDEKNIIMQFQYFGLSVLYYLK